MTTLPSAADPDLHDADRSTAGDGSSLAELAEAFRLLVRELADGSLTTTAQVVPGLTRRLLPQAHYVELVEHRDGRLRPLGRTDATIDTVLRIGEETGAAPVLEVLHSNDVVVCPDVRTEERWPEWARRVGAETSIASALCFRLYLTREHRVAFTLYSEWPEAFDSEDVALGSILASYCSLASLSELVIGEPVASERSSEVFREIGVAITLLTGQGMAAQEAHRTLTDAGRRLGATLEPDGAHPAD
ncbi:hypothetical protein FHX74_001684 [Friedmanniella endophytica]|uniref:GAF domain-containing protein n=1 Tax=Microlunatus kandeliicorticis TaxID=1759536 RepID=A0A7W3IRS8_9ACTN|nr:GAF domain-containing protein [Microlunatus kandeliicorticis]MBA8794079.1 hypothetical protein [Microlunatus kandeliicorticis]